MKEMSSIVSWIPKWDDIVRKCCYCIKYVWSVRSQCECKNTSIIYSVIMQAWLGESLCDQYLWNSWHFSLIFCIRLWCRGIQEIKLNSVVVFYVHIIQAHVICKKKYNNSALPFLLTSTPFPVIFEMKTIASLLLLMKFLSCRLWKVCAFWGILWGCHPAHSPQQVAKDLELNIALSWEHWLEFM